MPIEVATSYGSGSTFVARRGTVRSAVRTAVLFLAFFLILDLEFSIWTVEGQGERIGHSATLIDDELVQNPGQSFQIKVTDLLYLLIFGLLVLSTALKQKLWFLRHLDLSTYTPLLLFICVGLIGLLVNADSYTVPQFLICLAYLAKFAEVSLAFVFVRLYLQFGGRVTSLLKAMAAAASVAAVIGIVNPFTGAFSGWLIQDRVQFYGILAILATMILCFALSEPASRRLSGLPVWSLWPLFLLLALAVLLSGKRTVLVGFIAASIYVLTTQLRLSNFRRLVAIGLVLAALAAPFISHELTRSLDRESAFIWEGLSDVYAERISDSWLTMFGISGLDYSFTERLAKWLIATDHFLANPVIGIGFWGAPYVHNFVPDSALFQLLVETGLVGVLFFGIFLVLVWRRSKATRAHVFGKALRAAVVGMVIMGLTANPFYVFNLLAVFLIIASVSDRMNARDQTPFKLQ